MSTGREAGREGGGQWGAEGCGWQEELARSGQSVHLPLACMRASLGGWTWLLLQASTTAVLSPLGICLLPTLFTRKHLRHF